MCGRVKALPLSTLSWSSLKTWEISISDLNMSVIENHFKNIREV
jgi:hypothetical protein